MRKLAVAIVVTGVVALGLDALARAYVERRVASEISKSFRLDETPDVTLEGWPFAVHVARGRLPVMSISIEDLHDRRIRLERVSIRLNDVTFSPAELASGSPAIHIRRGRGKAVISERALNVALRAQPGEPSVRLERGRAFVSSPVIGADVESSVVVQDGRLLIVSSDSSAPVAIDLPGLPGRLAYEAVEITDGSLTLTFAGRDTELSSLDDVQVAALQIAAMERIGIRGP